MKRFFAFVAIMAVTMAVLASCGSSQGHCDAYGSVNQVENSDLASK